eukprot:COSAG06_NODE_66919_length_253_cov_0.668831_1_plen_20_part_10
MLSEDNAVATRTEQDDACAT